MRRTVLTGVVGMCLVGLVGCVGVSTSSHRYTGRDQVAVVGDRVFVIDPVGGAVREIDLARATPLAPQDETQG